MPKWQVHSLKVKPLFSLSCLIWTLFVSENLHGSEKVFTNANFSIVVPDNWEQITNAPKMANLLALFRSPDQHVLFMLLLDTSPGTPEVIDEQYVKGFEESLQMGGRGKLQTGRYLQVAGVKAYEREGTVLVKGRTPSVLSEVFIADRKTYAMQAMKFDGEAAKDEEIRKMMGSFRFLTPPAPLGPLAGASPAYRFGYTIGRLSAYIMIPVAIVVFVIVMSKTSRRTTRTVSQPPPLPPKR